MARQRSAGYSSRRPRSWGVVAPARAVGPPAIAGCSSSTSSGTSASSTGSSTALPASGTSAAPGNATSGTIDWWSSPINTSGVDVRTVLIKDFEAQYPNIHVSLTSAPNNTDTNRATLATDISAGGSP